MVGWMGGDDGMGGGGDEVVGHDGGEGSDVFVVERVVEVLG